MLTTFNTDLKPFEDLASSFAVKELAKTVDANDRYPFGPFFNDILEKAYDVGFFGMTLPEDFGGVGQGISALCVILDHISRADSSLGGIIFTNAVAQEIILTAGAGETASKIFSEAANVKEFLLAYPAFCNPGQYETLPKASISGSEYALTGTTEYLVLGNIANQAVIPARFGNEQGYSFFLVDLNDKSVKKSDPIFSLGLHACPAADVNFTGTKAKLLGGKGNGALYFDKVSKKMHVGTAAMAAGILKGSFKDAFAYAQERFQGGRAIINWSEVSMILSNISIKSSTADLCVAQVCQAIEKNMPDYGRYAVGATLQIHELACDAVTDGVQVLGGNGFMKDYPQEKRYRDARQIQSFLGTAPLKRLGIIRELANPDESQIFAQAGAQRSTVNA